MTVATIYIRGIIRFFSLDMNEFKFVNVSFVVE